MVLSLTSYCTNRLTYFNRVYFNNWEIAPLYLFFLQAPKDASDAPCARSTDGGAGVCVYLTRCDTAKTITEQNYLDIYCSVDSSNQG